MPQNPNPTPAQVEFPPTIFLVQPWSFDDIHICPNASSFFFTPAPRQDEILAAISCKTWSCRSCAQTKIRRLAAKTCAAAPNRLLTLTVDPSLYDSPRAAFESTAKMVPELIRMLRTKFGPVEYLRVTEQTKKGWPHYHLLVRSAFIPHAVVKTLWQKLTKATIVDLRQVQKTFSAFQYLVKYLSKMHSLDWTERHCSYSVGFFPPDETAKPVYPKPWISHRDKIHPILYLAQFYNGQEITRIGYTQWKLDSPQHVVDRHDLDAEAWRIAIQPDPGRPSEKSIERPVTQQPLPIKPEQSQRHEF